MKKTLWTMFGLALFLTSSTFAADEATPATPAPAAEAAVTAEAPIVAEAPAPAPAAEETADVAANENLEFVSGEVSVVDAAAESLTVKLHGETEENVPDKTLTVTTDASTDITDGEKDRELGSLSAGTEVDVEYDPASKKATYIFVY